MVDRLRNTDIKVKIPLKCNCLQGSLKKKKTLYVDTLKDRSKDNFEAKFELMSQSPMISKSTVLEIPSLILEK